ncbi:Similar to V-type proton ATPase subunit e; acc. no. Q3E7B6 [Pyronema omphalodes CBS 100304]|uniref:Similar to V-type proton ATPase subunit e acc. no. Q3E7B6 n=1 Tax=Pyronema omphalodes (strain CBS 100304) TaxID=1076935 RepID=U4LDA8_PYROM|nr:Similar to V-type proton ATPase subunit e; acc. no. Q3E7B6 [Pyronema omphalodes CBS 100304]
MANGTSIFVGFVIVAIASVLAYFFSPKGENQTSIWRSSLILAFVAMYLMWALTLLAQLHPLIAPRRSDLRPEHVENLKMMMF